MSYKTLLLAIFIAASFISKAETYTSADYATNGLIGHWDGIENAGVGAHDDAATRWCDLSGKTGDFFVRTCARFTGNGLFKSGEGVMATNVVPPSVVRTIEVVMSGLPETGWVVSCFLSENQNLTLNNSVASANGARKYLFDYNVSGWVTWQKSDRQTATVTYTYDKKKQRFYQNGVLPEGYDASDYFGSSYKGITLGGRGDNTTAKDAKVFGYTIHAVRLYSRELTAAEAARHARIDQIRFFGASPDDMPERVKGSKTQFGVRAKAGIGGLVAADDFSTAESREETAWCDVDSPRSVGLRAVALPGWKFSRWTGDWDLVTSGATNDRQIVVSAAYGRVYEAIFEPDADNPVPDYVQDGLVGRWDGVENAGAGVSDTGATAWKDLTGLSGDFIVNGAVGAFSRERKGLAKTAAGFLATNAVRRTDVRTVEAAISGIPDTGYVSTVFIDPNQTLTVNNSVASRGGARVYFFDKNKTGWQSDSDHVRELTLSVTYAETDGERSATGFFVDGRHPTDGSPAADNWTSSDTPELDPMCLGGRPWWNETASDNKVFGYALNSVRFYTRQLSRAEVAYNHAVDCVRFRGLPVSAMPCRTGTGGIECRICAWTRGLCGTVSVDGGAESALAGTDWSAFGTSRRIRFTAKAGPGCRFLGWRGDAAAVVEGTLTDLSVTVESDCGASLEAVFSSSVRYVQDGLVGHWDALENAGEGWHDPDIAAWKDLTGKTGDIRLNGPAVSVGEDSVLKSGTGRMGFVPGVRRDVRTVEVVVSSVPTDGGWMIPVYFTEKQHVSVKDAGPGQVRKYFTDDNHYGVQTMDRPDRMTVAALFDSATSGSGLYINGAVAPGEAYSTYWAEADMGLTAFGARDYWSQDSTTTGFHIHAVRFYNRKLTAAEIARNAKRDAIRFFGAAADGMLLIVR